MFPTTIWTQIHQAGAWDEKALNEFAVRYRPPVLAYLRRRGFNDAAAEDLCQDVFLRVLKGDVLEKADRTRGRFRSLLLTVTTRTVRDQLRKRTEAPGGAPGEDFAEPQAPRDDDEFDSSWALHLTERALERMREQAPEAFDLLRAHLGGDKQDRQRLWRARQKLASLLRHEVALTCASPGDLDEELAHLAAFLQPAKNP